MSDTVEIKLVKPTHGFDANQEIHTLTLRRPTGKDVQRCGFPYFWERNQVTGEVAEKVDAQAVIRLAAASAGVLESSIQRLDAVDIYEITLVMYSFFHIGPRKTPSGDTSAPPAGLET